MFLLRAIQATLQESGRASRRSRALQVEAMVNYVIAMGLFRAVPAGEMLRCLADGSFLASSPARARDRLLSRS